MAHFTFPYHVPAAAVILLQITELFRRASEVPGSLGVQQCASPPREQEPGRHIRPSNKLDQLHRIRPFHLGAVAALFMFSWHAFAIALFLYWMCTGLGISMGYHRLHTHRSYQVPLALEYFFAVCGTLTLEGGPIFWVATHRIHHQKSDQSGDPHSPRDGAWWAHMGWLLSHATTG
jgi:fatty-acid desaturase